MSEDKTIGLFRNIRNPADLFGKLHLNWLHICLFAAAIGIYVGIINQVPFLYDTSFRDIAITYEWWVLFAVLIVSNANGWLDAGCKCFVFFLISQPIIFLVEIPTIGLQAALYYWLKIWLPITFLTFPGGAIAYYAKRQNALGAVVLGMGNAIVGISGLHYTIAVCRAFPRHLLSVLSCVGIIAFLVFGIQRKRWTRLLSGGITVLILLGVVLFAFFSKRTI